jgi:hypothetical protein
MQPWSVMWIEVVPSRSRLRKREAALRPSLLEGGKDREVLASVARQHHHPGDLRAALELLA